MAPLKFLGARSTVTNYFVTKSEIYRDENMRHQILATGDENLISSPNINIKNISIIGDKIVFHHLFVKKRVPIQIVGRKSTIFGDE